MSITLQILSIVFILLISYLGLLSFGPIKGKILYTKEEKDNWDAIIEKRLGNWLTSTNIIGVLTSFATVYLFFIGNAKLFSFALLFCALFIGWGGYFTNKFTKKIIERSWIKDLLKSKEQSAGVIATFFWSERQEYKTASKIIKYFSLFNIGAVIWLEFALFSDIASNILGITTLFYKAIFLFFFFSTIYYFVIKLGLRGFVFADLFQTPIIVFCTIILIIGALIFVYSNNIFAQIEISEFITPILKWWDIFLFVIHVAFLNLFLVLVTEAHWLRLWIFGKRETNLQLSSTMLTAGLWFILIILGFLASFITNGAFGEQAVIGLITNLNEISPLFLSAFWIAAVAALFTTADAQAYSFILVKSFKSDDGKLDTAKLKINKPIFSTLLIGLFISLVYYCTRYFQLPFEKLIFIIIPSSLNILPAIIMLAYKKAMKPIIIFYSFIGYLIFSIFGLIQPDDQFAFTLLASLVPFVFSVIVYYSQDEVMSDE